MTMAELTACGKPAVLIPLPSAIYNHQTRNAKVMEAGRGRRDDSASRADRSLFGPRSMAPFSGIRSDCRRWARQSLSLRRIDAAEVLFANVTTYGGVIMINQLCRSGRRYQCYWAK